MLSEFEFEWDRRKSEENRRIVSGWVGGVPITVVFTDRTGISGQPVRRIINARISNRKERLGNG
jgi:uncharacterized DUF497 family protein